MALTVRCYVTFGDEEGAVATCRPELGQFSAHLGRVDLVEGVAQVVG